MFSECEILSVNHSIGKRERKFELFCWGPDKTPFRSKELFKLPNKTASCFMKETSSVKLLRANLLTSDYSVIVANCFHKYAKI